MVTRTFRIAPSLARLAAREAGSTIHEDGFFDRDRTRNARVRTGGGAPALLMDGQPAVEIPEAHAAAILESAACRVERARTTLRCGGRDANLDRYAGTSLDLVEFSFADAADAAAFAAPAWLGTEVTGDPAYAPQALAWDGAPARDEVAPTDAGLSALLDLVEELPAARGA